jgi:Protein of unknown function with HXXEE motif
MHHSYLLWIATLAYALHILEEFVLDWKNWAINVLKLPVAWDHFAVTNGIVIVLGISVSSVGWALPAFSLSLPALMLINATFFHLAPFVATKGRFSPGLLTAIVLFYPIAVGIYWGAARDGVLNFGIVLASFLMGAVLMASPIVLLKIRNHPYFRQTR